LHRLIRRQKHWGDTAFFQKMYAEAQKNFSILISLTNEKTNLMQFSPHLTTKELNSHKNFLKNIQTYIQFF